MAKRINDDEVRRHAERLLAQGSDVTTQAICHRVGAKKTAVERALVRIGMVRALENTTVAHWVFPAEEDGDIDDLTDEDGIDGPWERRMASDV